MSAMPTSTAPPRRARRARGGSRYRCDRHRTRRTTPSHLHHVVLARYYDPTIGRFTATDPLADLSVPGTLDAYGYAGDSPVTSKDPSGLLCEGDNPCGKKRGTGKPACIGTCTGPPRSRGAIVKVPFSPVNQDRPTSGDLAYEFVQQPRAITDGAIYMHGSTDCIVETEGCEWLTVFLTEAELIEAFLRWSDVEATLLHVGPLPDFFADVSGVVADGAGFLELASLSNPWTAPAAPVLGGVSAVASGSEFVLGIATGDQHHITKGGVGVVSYGTLRGVGVIAEGLGATRVQQQVVDLVSAFYSQYGQTLVG